jgi:hypothetical protein
MNVCFGETLPQFHTLCECECFCETPRMFVQVVRLLCHNRELFRQSRDETVFSLFRVSCYDITRMCGAGLCSRHVYFDVVKLKTLHTRCWQRGGAAQLVETLRYKLEGSRLDSRWCNRGWLNYLGRIVTLGPTQSVTGVRCVVMTTLNQLHVSTV